MDDSTQQNFSWFTPMKQILWIKLMTASKQHIEPVALKQLKGPFLLFFRFLQKLHTAAEE